MKYCFLYIRVSTDEQADKGYSQRDQEERLKRYAEYNNLQVAGVYLEDHSAKTFNRPKFLQLLADLKKQKGKINFLLFTKWDRFSRNAADAYAMINVLHNAGVEPQAIEQPLNMEVPENQMMLSFYLASPQVENERRSLNVKYGMRRAAKEGRWTNKAPFGYRNCISDTGRKYIAPVPERVAFVTWIFETIAQNIFSSTSVYKQVYKKGFKCSRSQFFNMVRNPVYCGRIQVKAFKGEDETLILGTHEPIITEELFYAAQAALNGRKKEPRVNAVNQDKFPLRGFLLCPKCGCKLTASTSTGRSAKYDYYHCTSACGYRCKTDVLHECLHEELKKYKLNNQIISLYKTVLSGFFDDRIKTRKTEIRMGENKLVKIGEKVNKLRELLVSNQLEPGDYQIMKKQCTEEEYLVEKKLSVLRIFPENMEPIIKTVVHNRYSFADIFNAVDITVKREMLALLFPDKLKIDGDKIITSETSEMLKMVFNYEDYFTEMRKHLNENIPDVQEHLKKVLKAERNLKQAEDFYLDGVSWFINSSALSA